MTYRITFTVPLLNGESMPGRHTFSADSDDQARRYLKDWLLKNDRDTKEWRDDAVLERVERLAGSSQEWVKS